MTNIYPFKAITPISRLEYEIQNKFIFCTHKKEISKYCNKIIEVKNNTVAIKENKII